MRTRSEINKIISDLCDKWFEEWHKLGGPGHPYPEWDYEKEQSRIVSEWCNELAVGDHCHINHWSDVSPCTVIRRTPCSITVRYDKAKLSEGWKPEFIPGGFSAHCINQEDQKWDIEEDPDGKTETFRWSKKYGVWKNRCDEKLFPEWEKYYDYNF